MSSSLEGLTLLDAMAALSGTLYTLCPKWMMLFILLVTKLLVALLVACK
jgi:hypothetical protein